MAETVTQKNVHYEDPEIAAYKTGIYKSARDYMNKLGGFDDEGKEIIDPATGEWVGPTAVPTQAIAGLSAGQRGAGAMLRSGLGAYEPYISGGAGAIRGGMAAISESAMPMMGEAYGAYGRGMDTLRDAERLAGATRGAQGQYQQQAMRGLTDEMGAARAGTRGGISALRGLQDYSRVLGSQGQAGMQDLARRSRAAGYGGQAGLQGIAGQSLGAAERGIAGLEGTGARYDPRSAKEFYDPYLQDVIQAEQAEIDRLGLQQSRRAQAGATSAGAFGGSRAAIQQSEIGRNVLGQQARTGAQLRSQGYQQAQQAAMGAFEQAQRRQQQAAQMTGQLGLAGAGQAGQQYAQAAQLGLAGLGQSGQQRAQASELGLRGAAQSGQQAAQASQLAQSLGQMGIGAATQRGQMGLGYGQLAQADVNQLMGLGAQRGQMGQGIGALGSQTGQLGGRLAAMGAQQGQMGQMLQQSNLADVSALMNLGNMTQQQAQNVLNAQYKAQMDAYQQPFRQYGFLADLTKALPSSETALLKETSPSPGWFQQGAGLATGIAGMMGAFGGYGGGGGRQAMF
mgnify:FL=1